ncbi:MAG: hypothetical protein PUB69_05345 [Desulfovibrionaceae bacterium]|nr:hypothetical protein [Desulfovibrionaceae bacterium]
MNVHVMRIALAAFAVLSLVSCAPKGGIHSESVSREASERCMLYEDIRTRHSSDRRPFLIQASLSYGREGETRRVTSLIWGNGDRRDIRLDVSAGIGALVARIQDSADSGLTIFAPMEGQFGKAYVYGGKGRVTLRFGRPVPLTLRELTALILGDYGEVFGRLDPEQAKAVSADLVRCRSSRGELELNGSGLPKQWRAENGWMISLRYSENDDVPSDLFLEHPDGYRAVLAVKKRLHPEPYRSDRLALKLPPQTPVVELHPDRR